MLELENFDGVHDLIQDGNTIKFQIEGNKLHQVLSHIQKYEFKNIISNPPTLEELFMHYYGGENK